MFGSVLSIIPFNDDEKAIAVGNDVIFGLAASAWTSSIPRAIKMPERLQAGTLGVNTYLAVSFTSPFGGYQERDRARRGQRAIHEVLQTKSVWVGLADNVTKPFILR